MKPDKITAIIGGKIKEIKKLAAKINPDFDKDTIHRFRVAVKSLRSFLRLLRTTYDKPNPKIPGKFKRLYHIAGAIRDAQLELENLTAGNITLPVYAGKVQNDIKRQKLEWERFYTEGMFHKMKKKLTSPIYESLPPEALAIFYDTKVTSMKRSGNARPVTNAHVHNIRKHAKDIIYTAAVAKKEWRSGYEQVKHLPVKLLEQVATIIGDYNDDQIQFSHLNSFSSPVMETVEKNTIKTICKKEASKLRAEKKRILEIIKAFQ